MLFGVTPASEYMQVAQVVTLAALGAWVAIYGRRIDANARGLQQQLDAEKLRCDALHDRVKKLERAAARSPKRKPRK